ncbi:MAG TPA: HAMP domain-containing sensor histidine kinase [Vicinamibacterales bacterium]|nr:HAMP domain-containing sensor histidine kinase [Vicinamibacterales bacterium]
MTHGTRPNRLSPLLYDRGARLAAGLAVVVAIPVAVLFYFQFRSLNDLEATSAVVLRQLSSDTAESVTKGIEGALKRPHIGVLLAIPQARIEPPDPDFIAPVLVEGLAESPFIDEFYLWSAAEGAGTLGGRWLVFDQASVAAGLPPARGFRDDPEVEQRLLPQLREMAGLRRAIVALVGTLHGRKHYIQAQLRWASPARDRLTSLIAFAVDAERLRREYFPALVASLTGSLQQPSGFPPLRVTLADDLGRDVILSPDEDASFVDERTFPLVFFDKELLEYAAPYEAHREVWRLRTTYGASAIPEIVSASTRPQRALMVVVAAVMGIGVFLIAGAAAREVRLAELKSNFVASVSHDLKTPLALIQLFAETLELGRVRSAERAHEYYRIINGEAKKLTRLIENILDFSRMEAGLRPYTMEPADIGALVRHVIDLMNPQFVQGHFTVRLAVAPGLPAVQADAVAVERAVENLLANAVNYSREAREIDVEVLHTRGEVLVRVRDHGLGIPRREQRRIFRKFYRVHYELGGGPQGTGLGLAIVDHTMRGHGGYVGVDSEPGSGSTFTLHFPAAGPTAIEAPVDDTHSGDRRRAADAARTA